jgi:hypothetical protein
MSHPFLVTGAAGGRRGSTGRVITSLILTGRNPRRLEEFFREDAEFFGGDTREA